MRNALLMLCLSAAVAWAETSPDRVKIVVLHVNDLHGYAVPREFLGEQLPPENLGQEVGSLFSAATLVAQWRERLFAEDPSLAAAFEKTGKDGILFLDGGDTWSGALDDFESEGGNAVAAENSKFLDVDAAAVGNHSWDFGAKRWGELAAKITAHHPLLCANLERKDGQPIPFLKPWVIQEVRGVKIALIGLIAAGALESAAPENVTDFTVTDPLAALKTAIDEVRNLSEGQRPDLVFVLSHVAFERGKPALTQALGALDDTDHRYNVDLVIDAHSHIDHTIPVDEDTWLVQADHYGVKAGEVVLEYDRAAHRLAGPPRIRRIPLLTAQVPVHEPMRAEFAEMVARARTANDRPVAPATPDLRLPMLLRGDTKSLSSASGNVFTRAMLETGRARYGKELAVALVNQTGVRAGLYASRSGAITAGAVHAVSPFANKLSVVKIARDDLRRVLTLGVQHTSKLSWAGVKVAARQKGTDGGAEQKREIVSMDLETPGDGPVAVIAPSFLVGRELKGYVIPGSQVNLDLTDREALGTYLADLARRSGTLSPKVVSDAVGEPARLSIE